MMIDLATERSGWRSAVREVADTFFRLGAARRTFIFTDIQEGLGCACSQDANDIDLDLIYGRLSSAAAASVHFSFVVWSCTSIGYVSFTSRVAGEEHEKRPAKDRRRLSTMIHQYGSNCHLASGAADTSFAFWPSPLTSTVIVNFHRAISQRSPVPT